MTTRDRYRTAHESKALDERGFSLIELIVALTLLGIIFAAAMPAMYSALNVARNNRNRSIAADLASQQIDIVRDTASSNFISLTDGDSHTYPVVGGVTYDVDQLGEWVAAGATTGPCNGSTGDNSEFLRITVYVSWPNMAGGAKVQNQTILAPPVGSFSPYTGAIAVKVNGVAGPQQDIPVQITPPAPATPVSQLTGPDGCAYFAFQPAGSYTVTLNKAFYVDGQGNPTATTNNVVVSIGSTVQLTYNYDRAASLATNMVSASSPAGAIPPGVDITIFNTALLPSGSQLVTGTGTPQTVGSLYPYPTGFQVWAGVCADADPQGATAGPPPVPYYPGGTRAAPANVSGGATTPVTITLPSVDIKVTHLGVPVPNATVTAIHAPDPSSCLGGDTLLSSVNTPVLAPNVLRLSLPYGTWNIKATLGAWTGTNVGAVTLSPTVSTVPLVTVSIS